MALARRRFHERLEFSQQLFSIALQVDRLRVFRVYEVLDRSRDSSARLDRLRLVGDPGSHFENQVRGARPVPHPNASLRIDQGLRLVPFTLAVCSSVMDRAGRLRWTVAGTLTALRASGQVASITMAKF